MKISANSSTSRTDGTSLFLFNSSTPSNFEEEGNRTILISSSNSTSSSVVAGIAAVAASAAGHLSDKSSDHSESSPYDGTLMPLVNFHLNHSLAEASVLSGTGPHASTSSNTLFLVLVSVTLVGLILTTIIGELSSPQMS